MGNVTTDSSHNHNSKVSGVFKLKKKSIAMWLLGCSECFKESGIWLLGCSQCFKVLQCGC